MSERAKAKVSPKLFRRLLAEYGSERFFTVVATVIALATSFAGLLPAFFLRNAVNYLQDLFSAGQQAPPVIWPFAAAVLLAAAIQNLFYYAQTRTRTELSVRVTNKLRERIYAAVQRHSLTYHKKTTTGDLIARSTRDVRSVARFVSFAVFSTADLVVFLGGAIIILLWVDPVFALVALSPVPLATYLTARFGTRSRPMWKDASKSYGEVTAALQENIAGARVIRAFGQDQAQNREFAGRADNYVSKMMRVVEFWVVRVVGSNLIFSTVMPVSLVYGAYAAIQGSIGIGDIMLCFAYMRNVQQRLRHIVHYVEVFQSAAAGAERVFEILDEEPGIQSRPGATAMPPSPEGIGALVEFKGVSFGYEPEKPVLGDITFTAQPGQTIAIVGHTGSGKSTLISLIPRFYDATAGAILINGVDLRDISVRELRRSVGFIFQDTFLFSTSIRENIAYGRPGADFEAIQAAAQAARGHDFIMKLEHGYDTAVGERGMTLSGGQAQRIAIARAVLLDPKILVMDDATASVDSETERQIRQTMQQVSKGRTNFVIAHRISSVAHADHILVLEDGRIAEEGTHFELIARGGVYRRMYSQQFEDGPQLQENDDA